MKTPRRSGKPRVHPVADRGGWRPSFGYLAIALALAAVSLIYLYRSSARDDTTTASKATSARSTSEHDTFAMWTPPPLPAPPVEQEASASAPEHVEGDADPTRDLSFYVARGEKPTMPQVIERLHQAGIYTGLGAFNPPGTSPPLVGIAVPDNFELPPGYVRHHQTTDDGQPIEPILMYSPDFQFVDATNKPIEIPKDRVVLPEHAPPGLPIRRIEIPAPTEPQ